MAATRHSHPCIVRCTRAAAFVRGATQQSDAGVARAAAHHGSRGTERSQLHTSGGVQSVCRCGERLSSDVCVSLSAAAFNPYAGAATASVGEGLNGPQVFPVASLGDSPGVVEGVLCGDGVV